MKTIFFLIALSFALPLGQSGSQDSGLKFVSLEVKKEPNPNTWSPSVVSQKPPEIHPTLGRGTADATDSRNVADLKDKQEDRQRRSEGLDALAHKRGPNPLSSVIVYLFRTQIENTTAKTITRFVWAYHPDSSPAAQVPDQQYLCNVTIAPGQVRLLKVISRIRLPRVVDASAPAPPFLHEPTLNDMIINQIQFADKDQWRRPNWNPVILTQLGARKVGKGKCVEL